MLFFSLLVGQDFQYELNIKAIDKNSDYWFLRNNNNGTDLNNFQLKSSFSINKKNTSYIINVTSPANKESSINKVQFNETYIKHNITKNTFIKVGRYYRDFSNYLNDDLSTGSMLISNNAQPMPKLGLVSNYNFEKNEDIFINYGISHAVFDKNEYYTESPFLHEKFIYINIIKNKFLLGLGIVHEAMWAGSTKELGKQPKTFKDFLKVFISDDGDKKSYEQHANALGNHLGIWDFYIIKNNEERVIKFYYQHFFEDTSSFRFKNKWDGLWGLELTNYIPNTNILIEFIDTSNCCEDPPYQYDFYYWNYEYTSGWKYKNYILGNPFVNDTAKWNAELDNGMELDQIAYFGIDGKVKKINYNIRYAKELLRRKDEYVFFEVGKEFNERNYLSIFLTNNNKNYTGGLNYNIKF